MSAQENTEQLRSILGQFLVSLSQTEGYARNTVSAYQNDLNQLLEYLSQHYPALNSWSQVSGVMLNEFVDNLRLMKIARRGGEEKPIAPSTAWATPAQSPQSASWWARYSKPQQCATFASQVSNI